MQTTEAPSDRRAEPLVGRTLGGYRVERLIGRGGMGVVYEALHEAVGQRVAIKVLSHRAAEDPKYEEHVERFRREAVAIGRLAHPGLVEIHGYEQRPDGLSYIVMELLDGESLAARLDRLRKTGPAPPQAHVMELGRQLASALAAAHAAQIAHRDLKPENVMLIRDPAAKGGERAKILDFGIAKFLGDGPGHGFTTQNVALGTPTYMAPEQCEGAQSMDERVDVYALGVILYEALAGRPPFVADTTAQILIQQMTKRPPPLRRLAPQVDEALSALIHEMLLKDPQRRPAMAEIETRLAQLGLGARTGGRLSLRRKKQAGAVALLAFALGLGFALLLSSRRGPLQTAAVPPAPSMPPPSAAALAPAPKALAPIPAEARKTPSTKGTERRKPRSTEPKAVARPAPAPSAPPAAPPASKPPSRTIVVPPV